MRDIIEWLRLVLFTRRHNFKIHRELAIGENYIYTSYMCECGEELHLDKWQIEDLPADMAFDCPGKSEIK